MTAAQLQSALGWLGIALVALVWVYIASRLGAWGVARSWFEYIKKTKKEKQYDKRKDNSAG